MMAIDEVNHRRQHHVAAIAATDDSQSLAVESVVRPEPVDERADVLDGVLPSKTVVERKEGLPVAVRPSHVGKNQGRAEFVDEIIVPRLKNRP